MSSAISSATAAWPSLFGSTCGAASSSSSGASGLAQAEQQLFAAIDTNGNGSISQNELTHFMSALSGSASPTPSSAASTLFGALATNGSSSASSSPGGGISLQDFQSNISTFLTALRSQLAAAAAAGEANAGATASASSAAASGSPGSAHGMHHGHQGHGGADALLASLMQQLSTSPVQSSGLAGVSLSTLA